MFAHVPRRSISRSPAGIGERIAEARRAKGLSQAALAAAVSLDRTAVSKIETGRRSVSSLELARIGRALNRSLERLVGEEPRSEDPMRVLRRKRKAILRIAREHGVRSVRVFGSTARKEAGPESDIDLLVEMEPGRGLFEQARLLMELELLLGREVDVVTPEGLRDHIRDRVLREAVPL